MCLFLVGIIVSNMVEYGSFTRKMYKYEQVNVNYLELNLI